MKSSYKEIKTMAKERINSRFGDAILIIIIPSIIVSVFSIFTQSFTMLLEPGQKFIVDNVVRTITNMFASYVTLYLIIQFVRGKDGFSFEGVFSSSKMIINFVLLNILLSIISLIGFIPLIHPITDIVVAIPSLNYPNVIAEYLIDAIATNQELLVALQTSLLISFVISLFLVKFRFSSYLIVDRNVSIMESLKTSWSLTNGNYFRILFFFITFIGWYLLLLITCGLAIIYVLPLITTAYAYLYVIILEEKEGIKRVSKEQPKETDPFSTYYE